MALFGLKTSIFSARGKVEMTKLFTQTPSSYFIILPNRSSFDEMLPKPMNLCDIDLNFTTLVLIYYIIIFNDLK